MIATDRPASPARWFLARAFIAVLGVFFSLRDWLRGNPRSRARAAVDKIS